MTWSGRSRRERGKADSKRMLRKRAALGERFYSNWSLGDRGPSKLMKPGRGDAVALRREALRMEPEADGVGVRAKRRSKSRRRKDKASMRVGRPWSREAAEKPGTLLMETLIERAGGGPVPKWIAKWVGLKQKPIQVEPLAECFADEKPRSRPREVAPPGDAEGGKKRTRMWPGADKVIRSGALHSSIVVWPVDPDKHGPCARRRGYISD